MRRHVLSLLLAASLLAGVSACADVRERVDDVRSGASELSERARFCLSVARSLGAAESGQYRTAADAAEEALAIAPEELEADARVVVDRLRDGHDWSDPELQAAAGRLEDRTRELCATG